LHAPANTKRGKPSICKSIILALGYVNNYHPPSPTWGSMDPDSPVGKLEAV
jgi:hypothetical protein